MTTEDTTPKPQIPTEEQQGEDENSSGDESSSDGKKDEDSSDGRTLKSSSKPPIKPVMKTKPPIVGKIQGKSFKVSPPRMNNSPRGR
jgi:hypothetical protein